MFNLLNRLWAAFFEKSSLSQTSSPIVIPRKKHGISRKQISENALKVLYRLHKNGYQAYLVGGGVRDILLGLNPKDFDISTNATPEEVRRLFRNCRVIGRRFKLAHVCFGPEIIEVATFRSNHDAAQDTQQAVSSQEGRILRDNVYGTLEDDVWRRDFTVNALYYNIADFSVVDYTGGMKDLSAKRLRMIGEPSKRFREDPVRIIRAIRFAAKLGLRLDPSIEASIKELKLLLEDVPPARLFEEILKLFHGGAAVKTFELLQQYGVLWILFPLLEEYQDKSAHQFIIQILTSTDKRIAEGKSINPAFLFAGLLWPLLEHRRDTLMQDIKISLYQATLQVADDLLRSQSQSGLTRRYAQMVFDIWMNQIRLVNLQPRRVERLLEDPLFRASYDFFGVRAQVSNNPEWLHIFDWWTRYQIADNAQKTALFKQTKLLQPARTKSSKPPRRRRKPKHVED